MQSLHKRCLPTVSWRTGSTGNWTYSLKAPRKSEVIRSHPKSQVYSLPWQIHIYIYNLYIYTYIFVCVCLWIYYIDPILGPDHADHALTPFRPCLCSMGSTWVNCASFYTQARSEKILHVNNMYFWILINLAIMKSSVLFLQHFCATPSRKLLFPISLQLKGTRLPQEKWCCFRLTIIIPLGLYMYTYV